MEEAHIIKDTGDIAKQAEDEAAAKLKAHAEFKLLPFLLQKLIEAQREVQSAPRRDVRRKLMKALREAEKKWVAWCGDRANAVKVKALKEKHPRAVP